MKKPSPADYSPSACTEFDAAYTQALSDYYKLRCDKAIELLREAIVKLDECDPPCVALPSRLDWCLKTSNLITRIDALLGDEQ